MAINVADNFSYKGSKPLDARTKFSTVADMVATPVADLYDGCEAYVTATKKYYSYDSTNEVDETLGKWRERQSGGSGTSDYSDLSNKPSIENVTLSGNKSASDLGLEKGVELTQAEYDALSHEEQMNGTTYYITDGEGGGTSSVQKATLNAGATTVSFSYPTTGDYIADVYTSDGRSFTSVDTSVSGTVTFTFVASESSATVFMNLKGV